jgi:hypothetical protein
MECPQCGARTQVYEKRGPFRDRRCTDPTCRAQFTTREQIMLCREGGWLCARTRAAQIATSARAPAERIEGPDPREAAREGRETQLNTAS